MIHKFTDNEIKKALEKIPQDVENTIFSVETASRIGEITTEQDIPDDQKPAVAEEVLYVLLQLTSIDEMKNRLVERLNINETRAKDVVDLLLERVLERHHVRVGTSSSALKSQSQMPQIQTSSQTAIASPQESTVPAPHDQAPERVPRGLPTHQISEQVLEHATDQPLRQQPTTKQNPVSQEKTARLEVEDTPDRNMNSTETEEHPQSTIPRYAKPLTKTPRYDNDPYHEPIE